MTEANVNTTHIEVPQVMSLDALPAPEPIQQDKDEIPVYKDDVRDAIFAKRRQLLEDEMVSQGLEPNGKKDENPPETPAPEIKESIQAQPEPQVAQVNPEQEEFLLNVYGQTKKLTKDELIREAQKGMAATQIFQEGYRMKDEALQIANSLKQNLQPQQVAKENPPVTPAPIIDKEKAQEIAKRINYGSEEDQTNALMELGALIGGKVQGQAHALPPEQLINTATQQTIAILEMRNEQDVLRKEFSDIIADPAIASATDVIVNQLAHKYGNEGVVKTRLDLFREAGTLARERYLKPAAPSVPQQPTTPPVLVADNSDKIERKRSAPKPPPAVNKVAVEPPPSYGVGASSIVNQMRKARGQPILT